MTNDDSYARYEEQEARRKTLAAELRISTKAKLFDLLQAAGIARVTVTFDGQGDSGQIEDISAFSEANKPIKLPGSASPSRPQNPTEPAPRRQRCPSRRPSRTSATSSSKMTTTAGRSMRARSENSISMSATARSS